MIKPESTLPPLPPQATMMISTNAPRSQQQLNDFSDGLNGGQNENNIFLSSSNYFRKDLLWKPLIRRFRRYLKKEVLSMDAYMRIFSKPMATWGQLLCEALVVPDNLADEPKIQATILLLMASHRIVRQKCIVPECRPLMQPYINDLWPKFFQVFNNSNQKYRLKFFSDPLVHFLWARFINEQPQVVQEYVQIASQNGSNESMCTLLRKLFLNDILKIQMLTNC